uniref:Uncharacterized protein n=1 Tax=Lessonia spicata TaxID=1899210 RepID=A0A516ICJ2_9PHAE|nr:hypothetical protein [Lessonia spicata]QDP13843.1 hypothetical protein [Lessonia spicata]QWK44652.1 hypothetical protein [Lessonia spicata]
MEKTNKYSEIDLTDFYVLSPVFKRYSRLNLWSENFSEYHNINYCSIYLSQYICGCTQKYILEHFNEYFLLVLHKNPKFLKFLKSGFFKYITPHFLFFFKNNHFFFSEDSYEEMEIFVEEYFQRYIQIFFKRDLLICLVACMYELVPNSFKRYLQHQLEYIHKEIILIELNNISLSNSVIILNFIEEAKNKNYPLGFNCYKKIIKNFYFFGDKINIVSKPKLPYFFLIGFNYKIYKSLNTRKKGSDVLKFSFSSFFLEETIYIWGYRLLNKDKTKFFKRVNYILFELSKTSTIYKYLTFNKKVKFPLKICFSLFFRHNWCFYTFPQCVFKYPNKFTSEYLKKSRNDLDFQFLVESFQVVNSFDKKLNDIGIYDEKVNIF